MAVVDREENIWYVVDFAILMDYHDKEKEEEKIDKFINLAAEVRRLFRPKKVTVPIFFRALGIVPAKLSGSFKKVKIEDMTGSFQTAILISTTAMLIRF